METASKALVMAGGILIAILILGSLVFVWNSISSYTTVSEDQKLLEQITAFNRQYEVYQKKILRGSDIASVINKIRDNNRINSDNPEAQITWKFTLTRGVIDVIPAGEYSETKNKTVYDNMTKNDKNFKEFKGLYFQCTKIEYSTKTGKVNNIVFKELLYEDIFENDAT